MANDHKTYISEVVTNLLLVKNLKIISEAKYDKIVEHLQRPYAAIDPKLRGSSVSDFKLVDQA